MQADAFSKIAFRIGEPCNLALNSDLKRQEERLWYAQKALENGWSRDILVLQITTGLYNRIEGAMTAKAPCAPIMENDLCPVEVKHMPA